MWLEPDGAGSWTPVVRGGDRLIALVEVVDGGDGDRDNLQIVAWIEFDDSAAPLPTPENVDGRLVSAMEPWEPPEAEAVIEATVRVAAWSGAWPAAERRLDQPLAAGRAPQTDRLPETVALRSYPVLLVYRGWRYRDTDDAVRSCRRAYKAGASDMLAVCQDAASRFEGPDQVRDRMLAQGLLGAALRRQGRLDEARAQFERAAESAALFPGGLPAEQTRFLRLAAASATAAGDHRGGAAFTECALAIDGQHGHLRAELRDRNSLADAAFRLGDPARGIDEFRHSLDNARLLRSDWEEFNTLTWMGTRYQDIGRYQQALSCMERAGPLIEVGPEASADLRESRAIYLTDLGWLQLKARRRGLLDVPADEVARGFDEALAVNTELGIVLWQANSRMNLAELAIQERRPDEAGAQLAEARELLSRAGDFEHATYQLALEGELALLEDDPAVALGLYEELAAAEGRWAASWWADYGRARSLAALGRYDDAPQAFEDALAALEGAAARMDPLVDRLYFLGDREEVYDRYVAYELDRGHPGAAFAVSERSRDRTAVAAQRMTASAVNPVAAHDLVGRFSAASEALRDHEQDEAFVHPEQRAAWDDRRALLVERVVEAQAALASALRDPRDAVPAPALEDLQDALPATAVVLYYHVTPDELVLLAVRQRGTSVHRAELARHQLQHWLDEHRDHLLTGEPVAPPAALVEILLPVSLALQPEERLIMVPHGPLHALSFATLGRDGRPLIEDHALSYAPSARTLLHTPAPPPVPAAGAVVAADPTGDLQGARDEGRAVAALLGAGTPLEGDAVTREALTGVLATATTVHYAGHAVVDIDLPQYSYLRLAGGDRLTWMDLQGLPVHSSLVVLSGCETGRSLSPAAGEAWGLATALLHAGAGEVVASGWEVPDGPTRVLMERLHELHTELDTAEALRRLQLTAARGELGSEATAARVWGAFVVHARLQPRT